MSTLDGFGSGDEVEVNVAESTTELHAANDEVAALRRVATLVAHGVPSAEIFSAVSDEVSRLFGSDISAVVRFERDGTATVMGVHGGPHAPGARGEPEPGYVVSDVRKAARAVRFDTDDPEAAGMPEVVRALGIRSAFATPIVVEGEPWGAITLASRSHPLPSGMERRLADFTELVATALANAHARDVRSLLAEEQAALREVAVLVAQQPSPDEVFTAVTEAVGRLLGADLAAMHDYRGDGTATTIAGWSLAGPMIPIGTQLPLDGDSVAARIFHTGAAARMDTYSDVDGETAEIARGLRLRSTVGAPIVVDGALWGALMAATRGSEPLPDDAETRIAAFTELVATAIGNAQARAELERLAEEQAALRRVATLVAEDAPASDLFRAVTREVGELLRADLSGMAQFERDAATTIATWAAEGADPPIPDRWQMQPGDPGTVVAEARRAVRWDDWTNVPGPAAAFIRDELGVRSTVGAPIVVAGRLWGVLAVHSKQDTPLPPDTESRLQQFIDLVATAIANAESKSELAASRRRIVAASDEARRRIERDLHDGTQQRLVSLGLAVRAAEANVPRDRDDLRSELDGIATGLGAAVEELQELSRGIHPAILSQGGLGSALRTLARRSAVPVELELATDVRPAPAVEVAAYYVASEALANAAKHAQASRIDVSLAQRDNVLLLSIRDDGVGGADPVGGSGLVGMTDRLEALDGSIRVESPPGEGTRITAELPL